MESAGFIRGYSPRSLGAVRDCDEDIAVLNKMQPAGVNWRTLLQLFAYPRHKPIWSLGVDLASNQEALYKAALSRPQNERRFLSQ